MENEQKSFKEHLSIKLLLLVFLVLFLLASSFIYLSSRYKNQGKITVEVKEISLSDFKSLYDTRSSDKPEDFIILDLRPESEWEERHIPYSVPFPPENLDKFNNVQKIDRFKEILVVSDGASETKDFIDQLKKKGWQEAKEFYGLKAPLSDWFNAGYPESSLDTEI